MSTNETSARPHLGIRTRATNYLKATKQYLNSDNFTNNRSTKFPGQNPNDSNESLDYVPIYTGSQADLVGPVDPSMLAALSSPKDESNLSVPDSLNDIEQQCILIPTYAFRNQSDGTSLDQWTVRVRGWAYATQRKSRKRKIMMVLARSIMPVKDDVQGKLLEDRFGLFLAKSLRNQEYIVKVISLAHPSHLKFGGDPDVDEQKSEDGVSRETEDGILAGNWTEPEGEDSDIDIGEDGADDQSFPFPETNDPEKPTIHITTDTGHFSGTIHISTKLVEEWISKANETSDGFGHHSRLLKLQAKRTGMQALGYAALVDPEGISIISDIDDTIKDTDINSGARTVLSNTFLKDSIDVPGMANRYMEWYRRGASIHYVSNSPWQLFPMLKSFFDEKCFPPGSAHLKFYNGLKSITEHAGVNKKSIIQQILEDFPLRRFILVGDSGESDMEIYAEIVKNFPGRILHVFIRDVSTKRLENLPAKRSRSLPFLPMRTSSAPTPTTPATKLTSDNNLNNGDHNSNNASHSYHSEPSPLSTSNNSDFEPLTPLEIFQQRVEMIRKSIEDGEAGFTLFLDSKDLLDHYGIDAAFQEFEKRQHGRF